LKKSQFMVMPYIDIHTHKTIISEDIISIQSVFLQDIKCANISSPFTAGIHPWHAEYFEMKQIKAMLEDLKGQNYWIAVGEAGLDKKSKADFTIQKEVFELQLDFAEDNKMPLIIHNVKAWNEIIYYRKNSTIPFIFHNYHGHINITKQLLGLNCYFSFGASLPKGNSSIKEIPIDKLFFETDESQKDIRKIYQCAADSLQCSVEILRDQIFTNYHQIFKRT
jgi:TatD DNase family protein